MHNRAFPALLLVFFASPLVAQNSGTGIESVETGLTARVHIKGQPAERWTIAQRMDRYHVPGASAAFVSNGKVEWAKGFGFSSREDRIAVTPDTMFQAASISKPVAAMTALRLIELGKLSLDEDVNVKLRSWKLPVNDFTRDNPVTLRKILSHTAGLTVHGFPGYAAGEPVPTLPELLDGRKPANSQPVRVDIAPGTEMRYSGGGYEVMQQLIEDVTGRPFAEVAQELVLDRLGMRHSTYRQPPPATLKSLAASAYRADGQPIPGKYHIYPEDAAAGLWTTPSDLAQVILEIQHPGRVLKADTVERMLTPVLDHWGLGFQLQDTEGQKSFSHGGSNAGFQCLLFAYRNGGQGAVVMTNGDAGSELAAEIVGSIGALNHWPDFKPVEKEVVALNPEVLSSYVGRYQSKEGFVIDVSVAGGKLYVEPVAQHLKAALLPQSENSFFDPDGALPDVHFSRASDGTFELSGGGLTAKRIK